ncbi:OB-fold-containig protein [Qipengyuania spongiae]|uniref:YqiJ family protein n=1 Tax=Qipengyuania spongiae TaxID=2909673 RepID=A0ABY5SZ68_9SPHN|nr:YqiJ family protein [Qipengyuania spongiae]
MAVMLLLGLVQLFGIGDWGGEAGADIAADTDGAYAVEPGFMEGLLALLGLGRVPLTIWLALLLLVFSGSGLSLQLFCESLTGAPLHPWLAATIATAASLPMTSLLARPLGAILPKDHTTAVTTDSLVGRRAEITDGVARAGSPARARVHDVHGQAHHVMVEPHEASSELRAGEEVLLVRREDNRFFATALAERRLSPTGI